MQDSADERGANSSLTRYIATVGYFCVVVNAALNVRGSHRRARRTSTCGRSATLHGRDFEPAGNLSARSRTENWHKRAKASERPRYPILRESSQIPRIPSLKENENFSDLARDTGGRGESRGSHACQRNDGLRNPGISCTYPVFIVRNGLQ